LARIDIDLDRGLAKRRDTHRQIGDFPCTVARTDLILLAGVGERLEIVAKQLD